MAEQQIYWEDVEVGSEIPTSYSVEVNSALIVDQISGSQDYNLVHHDREHARSTGVPDIFLNTGFLSAMLARLVTDWIGSEGWLERLQFQMRRMHHPGDIVTAKGKVTDKYVKDDVHYVDCDIWLENQREGVGTPGKATVILPSKK